MKSKELLQLIPKGCFWAERDISLLSASVFGEAQAETMKKEFGVGIFSFWFNKGSQIRFYRSRRENDQFSQVMATRYVEDPTFANTLAERLVCLTDELTAYIHDKTVLPPVEELRNFFDHYKLFFAIRQAVNWGGEFLHTMRLSEQDRRNAHYIIQTLDKAYKYNELVIPAIEKFFAKFQLQDSLYDEVLEQTTHEQVGRSVLFIDGKRFVLTSIKAQILHDYIEKDEQYINSDVKEIKGLAVGGGMYTGKVRLVLDLSKLDTVQSGDVLVTHMTRPQFNDQITNVGAIVTNEGGVLCHAANLAREFNIPCVVGTKIATEVLKVGMVVEVNGQRGIVRILDK